MILGHVEGTEFLNVNGWELAGEVILLEKKPGEAGEVVDAEGYLAVKSILG